MTILPISKSPEAKAITFKSHTITLDKTIKPPYTYTINDRYHNISAFFAVKLFKGTGLADLFKWQSIISLGDGV